MKDYIKKIVFGAGEVDSAVYMMLATQGPEFDPQPSGKKPGQGAPVCNPICGEAEAGFWGHAGQLVQQRQ